MDLLVQNQQNPVRVRRQIKKVKSIFFVGLCPVVRHLEFLLLKRG